MLFKPMSYTYRCIESRIVTLASKNTKEIGMAEK